MELALNLIFALLGYLLADWLLAKTQLDPTPRVIAAVLFAIVVFFLNLAAQVV